MSVLDKALSLIFTQYKATSGHVSGFAFLHFGEPYCWALLKQKDWTMFTQICGQATATWSLIVVPPELSLV